MKILQNYILRLLLRNLSMALLIFCFLFLMIDFFDRIDNIVVEDTTLFTVVLYFFYKIPVLISSTLPIAMLVASMFTIGMLARYSELTAMRAAGLTIFWIARPLLLCSFLLSLAAILFNETVVPYCARRVNEIYNLDIKKKDASGNLSQTDVWWRDKDRFFSVNIFDSRTNILHNFSDFKFNQNFEIEKRYEANEVKYLDQHAGWNMKNVIEYSFAPGETVATQKFGLLALPISEKPRDFYDIKTDPQTMSYLTLRKYIKSLKKNGVSVAEHVADLYAKISFPFVIFISSLIVLPFMLKPARSGSMAVSFMTGLLIGFIYYAVHSLSMALGRAELLPPLLAAWTADILMLIVGGVLNLGAESPH